MEQMTVIDWLIQGVGVLGITQLPPSDEGRFPRIAGEMSACGQKGAASGEEGGPLAVEGEKE